VTVSRNNAKWAQFYAALGSRLLPPLHQADRLSRHPRRLGFLSANSKIGKQVARSRAETYLVTDGRTCSAACF
jgi:hypothetical protein